MFAAGLIGLFACVATRFVGGILDAVWLIAAQAILSCIIVTCAIYLYFSAERYTAHSLTIPLGQWIRPWKMVFNFAIIPGFFGLWILVDIYLSKVSDMFPDDWGWFGVGLVLISVFLMNFSSRVYRK